MKHYDRCPVCGSPDISLLFTVKDHMVTGEEFPVAGCIQGQARFTQNVPDPADIGRYYQSERYISHTETREGLVNRLYHSVRNYTLKAKRKAMRKALGGKSGAILDYGCGTGAFLGEMQSDGWTISGIEPDADARNIARDRYGVQAMPPDQLARLPSASMDIITLWHVLEHVYDLHETLAELHRILRPGGKIFIAVPNYTSADALHYGVHWAAWDVPRHLYHFAPKSMETLLGKSGFETGKISPMWFDSVYVSMLSEQYRHPEPNMVSAIWYGLRSNLTAMANRERCSSLVYQATRP